MASDKKQTWAIFDVSNLVWKSFHANNGELDSAGPGVGAIFIALRSAVSTMRLVGADRAIWCFDSGEKLKREEILPAYKSTRKALAKAEAIADPEAAQAKKDLMKQLNRLMNSLEEWGLCLSCQPGYEADDIIAASAQALGDKGHEVYMVSTDKDLYQCLRENVAMVRTTGSPPVYTLERLVGEYGIGPERWPFVKAIAGCKGDDVPGVDGAGDKTAARYLAGTLPSHHKIHATIKAATPEWTERLALVQLPMEGVQTPEFKSGQKTMDKLQKLYKDWGFQWEM